MPSADRAADPSARHWRRPFRRACASTLPSMPTIWIVGGRFGISSDWIAGRCAPTQIDDADHRDRRPQAEHRAPIEQPSDAEAAARFRPAFGCRLAPRAACARAAARRHRLRICVWRMLFRLVVVDRRTRSCGTGAIRSARRRARIAVPCVRRSFSVPTPYANAAHTRPPHASVRSLRAGYREVNAGLGGGGAPSERSGYRFA